jgi:hypothetical protein
MSKHLIYALIDGWPQRSTSPGVVEFLRILFFLILYASVHTEDRQTAVGLSRVTHELSQERKI